MQTCTLEISFGLHDYEHTVQPKNNAHARTSFCVCKPATSCGFLQKDVKAQRRSEHICELYLPGVAVASFQTFAITSMAGILMIKCWRDRINNLATNLAQINSEWEKKRLIGENEIETLKKSQGELQQFLEETEIFAGGVSVPKPVISELDDMYKVIKVICTVHCTRPIKGETYFFHLILNI